MLEWVLNLSAKLLATWATGMWRRSFAIGYAGGQAVGTRQEVAEPGAPGGDGVVGVLQLRLAQEVAVHECRRREDVGSLAGGDGLGDVLYSVPGRGLSSSTPEPLYGTPAAVGTLQARFGLLYLTHQKSLVALSGIGGAHYVSGDDVDIFRSYRQRKCQPEYRKTLFRGFTQLPDGCRQGPRQRPKQNLSIMTTNAQRSPCSSVNSMTSGLT